MASNNISAGTWKTINPLPEAKSNGWLMADGRYIYYAGGTTTTRTGGSPEIYSALVNGDGTIGPWKPAGAAPKYLAFFSGTIDGGYMALAGGNTNPPVDSVYLAKLSPDGQLNGFTYLRTPVATFRNPGLALHNGWMYYVGGNTTAQSGNQVLAGKIATAIKDSKWMNVTALPIGLMGGIAFTYAGYLYYAGGSTDGAFTGVVATVYSAKINGDGTIGAWKAAGNMSKALHRFAAVIYKGKLIILGGQDIGGNNSGSMIWAQIQPNGLIGAFQTDDLQLPTAHRNSCATLVGNRIYLASGFTTTRIPNVWSLALSF